MRSFFTTRSSCIGRAIHNWYIQSPLKHTHVYIQGLISRSNLVHCMLMCAGRDMQSSCYKCLYIRLLSNSLHHTLRRVLTYPHTTQDRHLLHKHRTGNPGLEQAAG